MVDLAAPEGHEIRLQYLWLVWNKDYLQRLRRILFENRMDHISRAARCPVAVQNGMCMCLGLLYQQC